MGAIHLCESRSEIQEEENKLDCLKRFLEEYKSKENKLLTEEDEDDSNQIEDDPEAMENYKPVSVEIDDKIYRQKFWRHFITTGWREEQFLKIFQLKSPFNYTIQIYFKMISFNSKKRFCWV